MTKNFQDMLLLLKAAVQGTDGRLESGSDPEAIEQLAKTQGVWTLVYPELQKAFGRQKESMEFMTVVARAIQRNAQSLAILEELDRKGIYYCLLKGQAAAILYPHPDFRISGDTDILIRPEEEQKVINFLKSQDYQVEKRKKNDHHVKAWHPVGGLLEVHVSLYSDPTRELLFQGINPCHEDRMKISIYGKPVWTLGPNDGLVYLTAHYIKHFINGGGGIRQMTDLLLYLKKYEDKIDLPQYDRMLKELKYDKLIDVVKTIGGNYLGFSYQGTRELGVLADQLLSDSEDGGIFGFRNDSENNLYQMYCKSRSESRIGGALILATKAERTVFDKLFPDSRELIRRGYGYARHKLLVPVAWIHRFIDKLIAKQKAEITDEKAEIRMELLRQLGMID